MVYNNVSPLSNVTPLLFIDGRQECCCRQPLGTLAFVQVRGRHRHRLGSAAARRQRWRGPTRERTNTRDLNLRKINMTTKTS